MKSKKKPIPMLCLAALISVSCMNLNSLIPSFEMKLEDKSSQNVIEEDSGQADVFQDNSDHAEEWNDTTHSKETDPNYEVVFPQDSVNRIDITISPDNWEAMMADMTEKYGNFGENQNGDRGGNPNRPQGDNLMPQDQNRIPPEGNNLITQNEGQIPPQRNNPMRPDQGQIPPQGNNPMPADQNQVPPQGMGMIGGGFMESDDANPMWVPVTIDFEEGKWNTVGMRFKGNSSLRSSWQSGNLKLPFKLDFDEFEDVYEGIEDQRFYGFKQLSFSSNFKDDSFLHEKAAADIFREAGVPAAQTAFYQVYVDYGDGPIYFGLYTMVEVVDDTVIETQFDDDSGNIYKPSGKGATFSYGSFSEGSFDKETNEDEADYSDILELFDALHAETRISNPQEWRAKLENVFDVPGFLNYLAVNSTIQNWDAYGVTSHNYYLYHDPSNDLLTWIPWDNNEALKSGGGRGNTSISLDEVNEQWPLIRFLLDDPVYHAQYVNNVENVISGAFYPATVITRFEELHDLIQPYVTGSQGEIEGYSTLSSITAFENSLQTLIEHVNLQYQEAKKYVESF